MLKELIKQKEKDKKTLSKEFESWIYKNRGRQIKDIEYFLKKRSENIDNLIVQAAIFSNLDKINEFGIFCVGGYGRQELHPFSDIDLLLLTKKELSKEEQKKVEKFVSTLWDLGLEVGHSVRTIEQAKTQARDCLLYTSDAADE